VIGYDVLNYAWGRLSAIDLLSRHEARFPRLWKRLAHWRKRRGDSMPWQQQADTGAGAGAAYRMAQRAYQAELRRGPRGFASDLDGD